MPPETCHQEQTIAWWRKIRDTNERWTISGPELEEIAGFDVGPVHPNWQREWERRGLEAVSDVLRDEALAVYRADAAGQPVVYNNRLG